MLDPAIKQFFEERKEAWLKKNVKPSMSNEQIQELTLECETFYRLDDWISFAASNAYKRALSSHPSKFSHPDVGASPTNKKNKSYVSPVIFEGEKKNDGFLRTGNVGNIKLDSTGNGTEVGAIGEIGYFLSVFMADGKRLYDHFQRRSKEAQMMLKEHDFEEIRGALLQMIKNDSEHQSSSKIKQVYFPTANTNDDYHQLSILTPSGIVFDLRKRLDTLRFGDEIKARRESYKNNRQGESYKEIYDLTTIGYGGTKPQNISVLNNANGGKAHLFMSMPPTLVNRQITFPTKDFFTQSIYYKKSQKTFLKLHNFYLQNKNNIETRTQRDSLYQDILDDVIEIMWEIRGVAQDQFMASHSSLSSAQRIWLKASEPPEDDTWLDEILKQITHFIYHGYEKVLGKVNVKLGEVEYKHIANVVELNREALR